MLRTESARDGEEGNVVDRNVAVDDTRLCCSLTRSIPDHTKHASLVHDATATRLDPLQLLLRLRFVILKKRSTLHV